MLHALLTEEARGVHIWFCSVISLSGGLKNATSLDSPCCALSMSSLEQGCICQSLLCAITSKPIILDSWGWKIHSTKKSIWLIDVKSGTSTGADPENSERGGRVPYPPTHPPPPVKTSLFKTCSNKVTLPFQKHFENTRKRGGGHGPLGPSPKFAYVQLMVWVEMSLTNKSRSEAKFTEIS